MHAQMQEFQAKFRVNELLLVENDHWVWSLRPGQCTLGAGVLSMKNYAERLSDMTPQAGIDLAAIVKVMEGTLASVFQYDKINYLMLMMVDPHVHYHVVPRYSRSVEACGRTWTDPGWPALPDITANQADEATLPKIRDLLLKHLS